ncbi:procathepsin L-like [Paramacrobiotus metropolitanus]|uniref:procathepsin L-like n=1 Tax=Paramacrobiotus metropolitanus TaxID=2943436 RepID=UPI0024458570|nr:procathepsin L-like [Paramacrobiotus metropolitanus]
MLVYCTKPQTLLAVRFTTPEKRFPKMDLHFKLLIIVILSTSVALALKREPDDEWEAWKRQFGKNYEDADADTFRRAIWEQNVQKVTHHNLKFDAGESSFRMALNAFSDLKPGGLFKKSRTIGNPRSKNHLRHHRNGLQLCHAFNLTTLPDFVDWRQKGYVTPVKDQGECAGSIYYAITGAVEGQWFSKTRNLIPLSEQNLMDCCGTPPGGCEGGPSCSVADAYNYIVTNGIESLQDYPDEGSTGKCQYDPSKQAAFISGYQIIGATETELKAAVANIGPVTAAIDAEGDFQQYSSGVFYDPTCYPDDPDTYVLIVGYGTDPTGGDYWIVKNSWGANWGMEGYILMARNKNNNCGIASSTTFPYYTC